MTKSIWAVVIMVVLLLGVGATVASPAPPPAPLTPPREPAPAPTSSGTVLSQNYATTTFSFGYPESYTLNEGYTYDAFGPKKLIHGIALTIPASMATTSAGTNLSSDTRISVEQLPRARNCTGDIYLQENVFSYTFTEGGISYSLATTSGAAAGNRYEELVYALATSTPCTAVRYFLHSSPIENYDPGTHTEFDRAALLKELDAIRRSVVLKTVVTQ